MWKSADGEVWSPAMGGRGDAKFCRLGGDVPSLIFEQRAKQLDGDDLSHSKLSTRDGLHQRR